MAKRLKIFKVMVIGEKTRFYRTKQSAKLYRDAINESETKNKVFVNRGPDHHLGETD